MRPENMPGFRQPKIRSKLPSVAGDIPAKMARLNTADADPAIHPIMTSIKLGNSGGHHFCLQTVPILTGIVPKENRPSYSKPLYHSYATALAASVASYSIAVYGFNSGHFISRSNSSCMPFEVIIAADTRQCGRAMFK